MKNKAYSLPVKTAAFFLAILMAVLCLLSLFCVLFLAEDGYYADPERGYTSSGLFRYSESPYSKYAYLHYYYSELVPESDVSLEYYERRLDVSNTNYRYSIFDQNGTYLAGNAGITSYKQAILHGVINSNSFKGDPTKRSYQVVGTLDSAMRINDRFASEARVFDAIVSMRYWLFAISGVSFLVALALVVYLCSAAGYRPGESEPACRGINRIPTDVYFALGLGLIALLWAGLYALGDPLSSTDSAIPLAALAVIALFLSGSALLLMLLSTAARIKCRCFFKNSVVGWLCCTLWRFVRWCARSIASLCRNLPILWKSILVCGGYFVINVILIATANRSALCALLFVLFNLGAFAFVCFVTLQAKRLKRDMRALADGDLTAPIDEDAYRGEFKSAASLLGKLRVGVSRAVAEQVKSDRMRADLITNVSHDIKTPLTSIVNYVDLLRKEPLSDAAREYVEALSRAADRLKKLTLDVVEASKASSGTLPVSLAPTDAAELIRQCAAEYGERFEKADLTLVSDLPDTPVITLCDGRLMFRMLDNLLGNAAKYSLAGTRVYLGLAQDGTRALISLKNVSRDALNISPEELTERFVRGDASRSDGGSGLGLSIAKSLAELQGGALTISIDGDLFKASVSIPLDQPRA